MKRIVTDKAPAALGPYVQAVDTGSTVYCSGQLGLDPVTNTLAEGVPASPWPTWPPCWPKPG